MLFLIIYCFVLLVTSESVYRSEEEGRYYYPEFKFRAKAAHNSSRYDHIQQTLASAAGVYKNKTHGEALGISNTVFMTVVSYGKHRHYKLFLNNMLCYAQHYGIDVVVYVVHSHLQDPEKEVQEYNDLGIKAVSYPDELFWTLLYSKSTEIRRGAGRGDYESKVPSFHSHGALVMLVPVLEVMLHGFNAIFFDVDIAMVSDPIPYLIRGSSDFVSSLEMRYCPDTYTPTYPIDTQQQLQQTEPNITSAHDNTSSTNTTTVSTATNLASNSALNMLNTNWYTVEPNTGIMSLRSSDASIGFYTNWLINIIKKNEMNDQKALLRDKFMTKHSFDCLFGEDHLDTPTSTTTSITTSSTTSSTHVSQQYAHREYNLYNSRSRSSDSRSAAQRFYWVRNYTALIEDIQAERYPRPVRFCFLSELLFQNGQTAFACGGKPSYRDSWILEMYQKGLRRYNENNLLAKSINSNNSERYIITLHANFCDRKTHELAVRGLWLVQHDSPDVPFNTDSYCRMYEPEKTMYAARNWTAEFSEVRSKRNYMFDTFVQPGQLVQSTTGKEVYLINEQRMKQLIPDGDTFIATMGDGAWGDVRYLPQAIMNLVPFGSAIPSVKATPLPTTNTNVETSTDTSTISTTHTSTASTVDSTSSIDLQTPSSSTISTPHPTTTPTTLPAPLSPPPHPVTAPLQSSCPHAQLLPGMLVRGQASASIFFIDKHHKKRRIQNMNVFARIFGAKRIKDVIIVPDSVLNAIHAGEPLTL